MDNMREVITRKMESKEFAANIKCLEIQIKELTHVVAALWKNQDPSSRTQKPQASPQADKKSSFSKHAPTLPI